MNLNLSQAGFPETRWTLIQAVGDPQHPEYAKAMAALSELYWGPVYAYLRKRGLGGEEAADAAQGFFADIVLKRDLFSQADSSRGKLRNLVQKSLDRFLLDEERRAHAHKRSSDGIALKSLEREDAIYNSMSEINPEAAFDRRWALAVLHEALQDTERHYGRDGNRMYWGAFEARVLRPSITMTAPPSFSAIADELGFPSAAKADDAVRVVKTRIDVRMHQIVAETSDEDDVNAEVKYLMSLLDSCN